MSESRSTQSQSLPVLILSSLIGGTVFLLEPAKAAVLNWSELSVGPLALASGLLLPWALASAALAVLGIVLSLLLGARVVAGLLALYVGLWAQGNLLLWAYGPFDGTEIDWSAHHVKGGFELLLWAALFVLALLRTSDLRRHWFAVASLVLALQVASLAQHVAEEFPFDPQPAAASHATEHGFNLYSSERNVILLVLDSLQSDFFSEALQDPEFADGVPPGFVYYRNAVSLYALTQFSLQSMLTAAAVPDGLNAPIWARSGLLRRSVAVDLAERGFDAALVSFTGSLYNCGSGAAHRCLKAKRLVIDGPIALAEETTRSEVSEIFWVGLFRLTPHFLKPRVYDQGEWHLPRLLPARKPLDIDPRIPWRTRSDLAILDRITSRVTVEAVPPRFRFLHLFGVHPPARVDRQCRWKRAFPGGKSPGRRDRAIEASRCMLERVFAYLRALDDAGIYDDSLIFIVSDHGDYRVPVDPTVAEPALSPAPDAAPSRRALKTWHRGVPIFLAKDFGARGQLEISDAPVSLCDIPLSIYDALGLGSERRQLVEPSPGCGSIFAERGDGPDRFHFRYPHYQVQRHRLRREKGLPVEARDNFTFRPYVVDGHSWHPESWHGLPEGSRTDVKDRGRYVRQRGSTWRFERDVDTLSDP